MTKRWPRVIRDPVHDIIRFDDTPCDRLLLDLIDTPEFQRLRRIKHLGMSDLVFPGANHSRFAHSLGVMHVACVILDSMLRSTAKSLPDDQRAAVLAAALLHDVGHGPFSHAFEKATGLSHEARTLEIITDSSTGVYRSLTQFDQDLPDRLAVFFDEDIDEETRDKAEIPPFLTQIVSSQLDADRFDYLLRDSLATGTDYGRYDLQWLILQLRLDEERRRFYLTRKALSAAEAYVYARYHMYRSVYFHKTTRAAEVMVRLVFDRYKRLVQEAPTNREKRRVVPDAPHAIVDAFIGPLSLGQYLSLDDNSATEFFKACEHAHDRVLNSLGSGLIHRRLLKATDASEADKEAVGLFATEATEHVGRAGLDPKYAFISDTAADTAYRPYDPDAGKPASQIYIETATGGTAELSSQSDAVAQLKKRYALLRYYYPELIRDDMDRIAERTFRKEDRK